LVPIVQEFPDIFQEVSGLPPKMEIEFKIELEKDARPIALPLRPMAPRERWKLEKQVAKLLQKGFICHSISEWGAPVVFAIKTDGSLRLCVDYRAFNNMTRKNRFPFRGLMIYSINCQRQSLFPVRLGNWISLIKGSGRKQNEDSIPHSIWII